jgi:hypothetical protein
MNALTENRPTGTVNLAPQTFEQALTFANYLADSDLVPKDFKGKPGNCLIAMQWGAEVGLQALQALQSIAVINGRPALWGDGLIAIVRSSPACEYILEEDDGKMATCRVKRRGEPEQARTFSMDDAKAAGLQGKQGPWSQYPKRMRQMRARAFALRDVFPDVLRGMPVAEEVMDIPKDMGKADVVEPAAPSPSAELLKQANEAAAGGATSYQKFWSDTGKDNRKLLAGEHERLKATAADVDKARTVEQPAKQAADDAGEVTADQVLAKINEAKNEDALYVAADWINAITDNSEVAKLYARFDERLAELRA